MAKSLFRERNNSDSFQWLMQIRKEKANKKNPKKPTEQKKPNHKKHRHPLKKSPKQTQNPNTQCPEAADPNTHKQVCEGSESESRQPLAGKAYCTPQSQSGPRAIKINIRH